jgi:predicted Zn-dependent protease
VLSNTEQDKEALLLLESFKGKKSGRYKQALIVTSLRLGELTKAIKFAESLIVDAPDSSEYQLLYMRVLLLQGRYNEAEQVILDLYKRYPDNKQVRFNYAFLQFNLNNTVEAKEMFNALVKEDPESWFVLAQIAYDAGNVEEAVIILEKQTKNSNYSGIALHKLAEIHYGQQDFEKSLSVLNVLLQKSRLDAQAILLKAKNLIALKQLKEAKRQLDILFSIWNEDAITLLRLSKLQLRINDYTSAEKSLEIA